MEVTINYNGQALSVEVTVEVYEYLDRADHKTENLAHEQRRHWDGRETLHELLAVLDGCTEAQRRRFLLYALDGLSYAEIAALCGCSKTSVFESIEAVGKKMKKYFADHPND